MIPVVVAMLIICTQFVMTLDSVVVSKTQG